MISSLFFIVLFIPSPSSSLLKVPLLEMQTFSKNDIIFMINGAFSYLTKLFISNICSVLFWINLAIFEVNI